jgi:hypothetical protein
MSLDWDITNCKNMEALQEEENGEWAITNALIWATMSNDIGSLKAKTIADFYARTKVSELFGALVTRYDKETDKMLPYSMTFGDIEKRIGMHSNVFTITPLKWLKKMETFSQHERQKHYNVTVNQIRATYYSALAEVESYATTTTTEMDSTNE